MKSDDERRPEDSKPAPIDITRTQLGTGSLLGPYRIEGILGAGGMGEVFRAVDTRLGRKVAIKVALEGFSGRFEREARAISALNHPHICTLYDIGPNYLVMELVEGETLAATLKKGPLPAESVLRYGAEIADSLAAAHAQGIIHRDLKPGNIMVTKSGIKVLDFGLAKITLPSGAQDLSGQLTVAHAVIGTLAYMAPEQLEGKECDGRSDIFSLGLVLYEMAAGKRAFPGDSQAAVIAQVMRCEPDLDGIAPPQFAHVLKRCLEKDRDDRWQTARDLKLELEWDGRDYQSAPAAPVTKTPRQWMWPGVAILSILIAAFVSIAHFRQASHTPSEPMRLQITLPEDMHLTSAGTFSVSPDGRQLVFAAVGPDAVSRLWIRSLNSLSVRPLQGTEDDPSRLSPPFWSPDSRYLGFDAAGKLKTIDVSGGPAKTLCDLPLGRFAGGSWNRDGVIIFGTTSGVMRISPTGGPAAAVTTLDLSRKEYVHTHPSFLPDGKHFLYVRNSPVAATIGEYIGSLDNKPEEQSMKLVFAGALGYYIASGDPNTGQFIFPSEGALWAQTFHAGRMELIGERVLIAERLHPTSGSGFLAVSASTNGVLIYRIGANLNLQLTWYDRRGKTLGTVGEPGRYGDVTLSPDATRAAVSLTDSPTNNRDIWLLDLERSTPTRFTFDPAKDSEPVWSPDSKRIAFVSNRGGTPGLYVKASSGAGGEELLVKASGGAQLSHWSPDGKFLMYQSADAAKSAQRQWVLPLNGDRRPVLVSRSESDERWGRFSPDGRWIAYSSGDSPRKEIYVRPFHPETGGASTASDGVWMVSRGAVGSPYWRADGKELFYISPDAKVMAVEVVADSLFRPGAPAPLFQVPPAFLQIPGVAPGRLMDVSADGKRFLFALPATQNAREEFTAVLNWQSSLKK